MVEGKGRAEVSSGKREEGGMWGDPRRDPGFGTLEVSGHRGRASREPREAGRDTHTEEQRPTEEQTCGQRQELGGREPERSWERQKPGASDLHALPSAQRHPSAALGAAELSLMQAAWLLGALVVPQLLGFSHGARGADREWEGVWGGAQEEEREREALMLKVSCLGL